MSVRNYVKKTAAFENRFVGKVVRAKIDKVS